MIGGKNMRKRIKLLALLLGTALLACSCNQVRTNEGEVLENTVNKTNREENENQSKLDVLRPVAYNNVEGLTLEPGSYISIIGRYSDDSYWKEVEEGAQRAVDDINSMMGYKGNDKVKLTFSAPDIRDDVDEQINILDEELARYPIAISIAAIDTTACQVQFELAADNNIPIVTFDSGSDYQDIAAHVSTDNISASATAADKLAELIGGSGEVAVFVQDSLSMTAKEREKGFVDEINKKYPDISIVNIYHFDQLGNVADMIVAEKNEGLSEDDVLMTPDTITQEDVIKYFLEKSPNLKAIYTTNLDTTQMVANIVSSMEKDDLIMVGFDGGEEQIELLNNGVVDGLIFQNPYAMGYATVVAAARHVLELGNEAFVDSGYTWVTKENMSTPVIEKMLY